MSKIQSAIDWAVGIASDSSHGYDQNRRWGPDYDCSSLIITAWEEAGVPVKTGGATYTGNMKAVFLRNGFIDATAADDLVIELNMGAGLLAGDVLLHERNHTAMYLGDGRIVHASINELGTIKGGQSGDQTGGEICLRSYYNYPWDCVLRYMGDGETAAPQPPAVTAPAVQSGETLPTLRKGQVNGAVLSMQLLLIHKWAISCGPDGADGDFGANTLRAVLAFQKARGLETDGICGPITWKKLIN